MAAAVPTARRHGCEQAVDGRTGSPTAFHRSGSMSPSRRSPPSCCSSRREECSARSHFLLTRRVMHCRRVKPSEDANSAWEKPSSPPWAGHAVPLTAAVLGLVSAVSMCAAGVKLAIGSTFDPAFVCVSLATIVPLGVGGVLLSRRRRAGRVLVSAGSGVALLSLAALLFVDIETLGFAAVFLNFQFFFASIGLYGLPYMTIAWSFAVLTTTLVCALAPQTRRWLDQPRTRTPR